MGDETGGTQATTSSPDAVEYSAPSSTAVDENAARAASRILGGGEGMTLARVVLDNAANRSDEVAMRRKDYGVWWQITWKEVGDAVESIAAELIARKLQPDDYSARVFLIGDNEPELFWVEWAVQAAGLIPVCMYSDASQTEIRQVLQDSGARFVFAQDQEQVDKTLELASEMGIETIVYWDDRGLQDYDSYRLECLDQFREKGRRQLGEDPQLVEEKLSQLDLDCIAAIMYTSGTSGNPKGVLASYRYLLDNALRWGETLGAFPGANYVSYISPAWATEQYLGMALSPIMPMILNFPEEPETVSADIREIGAEFLFFSPRQWEMLVSDTEARMRDAHPAVRKLFDLSITLLEDRRKSPSVSTKLLAPIADLIIGRSLRDRLGMPKVKSAVNSGAALSPEIFERFTALGIGIRNVYGFTEIGIFTATIDDQRFDTVGRVLVSPLGKEPLRVRILDDEIQVRGGVMFDGYLNHPEMTAERFTVDGWLKSGDAGRFDEEGFLTYLDRLDDMRQLESGEKFAPQFIETRLRLSPYVKDVLIVGDQSRPYVSALVDMDFENMSHWAEEKNLDFNTHKDLSSRNETYEIIRREIQMVNDKLPSGAQVRRFAVLFKPLDPDEGELTRSRKIRRDFVEQRYQSLIEGLYKNIDSVDVEIEVELQDGRKRNVSARVPIATVGGEN